MADELKKKFQEMQEAKHGKKEELKIDEFEWIEVRLRILNYWARKTDLSRTLSAQQTTGGGQKFRQETPGNPEWEADQEVQGEPPDSHRMSLDHWDPGQWSVGLRDSAGSQVMMRGRIAAQVKRIYRGQAISSNTICVNSFLLRLNSPMHCKMQ